MYEGRKWKKLFLWTNAERSINFTLIPFLSFSVSCHAFDLDLFRGDVITKFLVADAAISIFRRQLVCIVLSSFCILHAIIGCAGRTKVH